MGDGGKIFRSTNQGAYWYQAVSGTSHDLETVFFGTGGIVYAAGSGGIILGSTNNTLLFTSNWGTQWNSKSIGINQGINGIHFQIQIQAGQQEIPGGFIIRKMQE